MQNKFARCAKRMGQMLVLAAVMGCTAKYFSDDEATTQHHAAGKSIHFLANKTYQAECTSCHVGYLPGLLPARSWKRIMADLENHFGENAGLENSAHNDILKYLTNNAADAASSSARSKKIAGMIPKDDSPLRITETPFWTRKHGSIKSYVWKREKVGSKSRCDSCHHDANKGIFDEHDVHIPK